VTLRRDTEFWGRLIEVVAPKLRSMTIIPVSLGRRNGRWNLPLHPRVAVALRASRTAQDRSKSALARPIRCRAPWRQGISCGGRARKRWMPDAERFAGNRSMLPCGLLSRSAIVVLPIVRGSELAGWQTWSSHAGFSLLRWLPRIGLRNAERDDHGDDSERQGNPQHPADHAGRAALPGFGCGLYRRRSARHRPLFLRCDEHQSALGVLPLV
jgi:hypothetical protein